MNGAPNVVVSRCGKENRFTHFIVQKDSSRKGFLIRHRLKPWPLTGPIWTGLSTWCDFRLEFGFLRIVCMTRAPLRHDDSRTGYKDV
ncbi:unnamed protein product [Protopolystoma xenopodis]|uniref:Uncharacterized protein n=1 Tax=Protopolystoma xenopodis TaxID=117903 RepID=A0A448XC19_9PLAT|nr:unnamed protein product [Protopolystoma xenopodis]